MPTAPSALSSSRPVHRASDSAITRGGSLAEQQPRAVAAEHGRVGLDRRDSRVQLRSAPNLRGEAAPTEAGESVEFEKVEVTGRVDQRGKTGGNGGGGHDVHPYIDGRTYVKESGEQRHETSQIAGVPARSSNPNSPQVAGRIRARLAELGYTESSFAEKLGRERTVISTILRRLDQGGNLRTDTIKLLVQHLGKSEQWLLTGTESRGTRMADVPGWAEAARAAAARHRFTDDEIAAVADWTMPTPPSHADEKTVTALVRVLQDLR